VVDFLDLLSREELAVRFSGSASYMLAKEREYACWQFV
jgi:hypothetical protein